MSLDLPVYLRNRIRKCIYVYTETENFAKKC